MAIEIVDLPIENCDFPLHGYVILPEGNIVLRNIKQSRNIRSTIANDSRISYSDYHSDLG